MTAEAIILSKGVTCTVKRSTTSNEASGFPKPTFATLYSGVPILVQDYRGSEGISYRRMTGRSGGKAFIPANRGYTLKAKDQIVVDGRTLEIVSLPRTRGASDRPGYQIVIDFEETK